MVRYRLEKKILFQSTHPRRVWRQIRMSCRDSLVSIHTPTQGVTKWVHLWLPVSNCFNPHTHAGCDIPLMSCKVLHSVSIHTPTQGVTQSTVMDGMTDEVSIHTPTQGVTTTKNTSGRTFGFQSTHPRRVWLDRRWRIREDNSFQSTHPRRVWPCQIKCLLSDCPVSIHTPTQGVTD